MPLVPQIVKQAPGKHVSARSAGWAFPCLLPLKKHAPRNPTLPFRSCWGIRVKMQDLSFLSPLGVSHLSLGGVSHLPLWGAPIHLWGVSSPLEQSPLEGGLPSALGVSCLPLRGLASPLGEISCLPLGGLPSPPGVVSHLFLEGSPISLGGLLSVLGEPPLGRVSHLFLGVLPSPLMGVSHPPLGGLLSPLESPLGGSPISSGGLLSPLEGVYHPPLGRSPVSPRGSPLGCLPFLLGCTALRRMILAHFCPLLPVRPLHSSGPA